jgi:hypothetical protein
MLPAADPSGWVRSSWAESRKALNGPEHGGDDTVFVQREERQLDDVFGAIFTRYRSRVRRWL